MTVCQTVGQGISGIRGPSRHGHCPGQLVQFTPSPGICPRCPVRALIGTTLISLIYRSYRRRGVHIYLHLQQSPKLVVHSLLADLLVRRAPARRALLSGLDGHLLVEGSIDPLVHAANLVETRRRSPRAPRNPRRDAVQNPPSGFGGPKWGMGGAL